MVTTCEHVKADGTACGSPALRDKSYCHFHERLHDYNNIPGNPDYEMPMLEDHLSVQVFLMQIAHAQVCGSITPYQASQMMALARTAMTNLRLARKASK